MIVPDKWKEGASNTTEGGGRKINENKLLSKKKRFFSFSMTLPLCLISWLLLLISWILFSFTSVNWWKLVLGFAYCTSQPIVFMQFGSRLLVCGRAPFEFLVYYHQFLYTLMELSIIYIY